MYKGLYCVHGYVCLIEDKYLINNIVLNYKNIDIDI